MTLRPAERESDIHTEGVRPRIQMIVRPMKVS